MSTVPNAGSVGSNSSSNHMLGLNANQLSYIGTCVCRWPAAPGGAAASDSPSLACRYTVRNPFFANTPEQLTVMPGEVVSVLAVHGDGQWLMVKNNRDELGMVPKANVVG
jgi:hypothetical protein